MKESGDRCHTKLVEKIPPGLIRVPRWHHQAEHKWQLFKEEKSGKLPNCEQIYPSSAFKQGVT